MARPVGYIRSSFDGGVNHQVTDDSISEIYINGRYSAALDGIEAFSHIIVVFWLNKIRNKSRNILKVHPRGDKSLPVTGIFATRSPARPNPMGITIVKLVNRENNKLTVKGLDAFDGSPVLDIKPYIPESLDSSEIKFADWIKKKSPQT